MLNRWTRKPTTTGSQSKSSPAAPQGSTTHGAAKASTPPQAGKRQSVEAISSRDQLPPYQKVLGMAEGAALHESLYDSYVALLLDEKTKRVLLLASVERRQPGGPDPVLMDLKLRIKQAGYTVATSHCIPSVIGIIRQKAATETDMESAQRDVSKYEAAFDNLLRDAIAKQASDIHVEVRRDTARVRYRIHGLVTDQNEWGSDYATKLCSVVYQVIAESDSKDVTFQPNTSQDGVVDRLLDDERVRVRLATTRAYPDGFDMVMRVLRFETNAKVVSLSVLGYNEKQRKSLASAIRRPSGVIIFAGTTGSGKSTSLKTILSDIVIESKGQQKIISVEDPPEYQMPGVTQSPVVSSRSKDEGEKKRNPFAEAIKAAMRLDPDKLMVGEVRDPLTAQLLVQMTQSGHLAFTTNHAASAFGILPRLRSLSIPNDVLGSTDFLVAMVHQALVGTLCARCRIPFKEFKRAQTHSTKGEIVERIRRTIDSSHHEKIFFRNELGCEDCHGGLVGRTVVAEVVLPDITMKEYIAEGKDHLALKHYRAKGGESLLSHGIEKIVEGVCCPLDIERDCGPLDEVLDALAREDSAGSAIANAEGIAQPLGSNLDDTDLGALRSSLLGADRHRPSAAISRLGERSSAADPEGAA